MKLIVTDTGSPNLSATQSFSVMVNLPTQPNLQVSGNPINLLVSGDAGPDYTVQSSTNLADWLNLFTTNSPALPFNWSDPNAGNFPQRFYRILLGP
ncbi:MAG: hypothetical protein EXS35_18690 [Pedosphaera sp.]|nr:hypothetical protein [Pedosphaera sp.]